MKDTRSLLLTLLSVGLVATWVYHIYDKVSYSKATGTETATDTSMIASLLRDSLQQEYAGTIKNLDSKLDSSKGLNDSLEFELTQRITEINQLKSEISRILKDPNSTAGQLKEAKQKIAEMQDKIDELRSNNAAMETEKAALLARLDQMTGEVTILEKNMRRLDEENKDLKEKIKQSSVFLTSALHFTAIDLKNNKEEETAQSKKADRFVVSFILQNQQNQYMNAEIFVVIIEPNGHVLQNSVWDSGMFDTKTEGKKSYTRRARFDYEKGEQKQLIFALDAINFQKGKYLLQVWHQGTLVGETYKVMH